MSKTTGVTTGEARSVSNAKEQERPISPAVDIFENEVGITVLADMPGVSKDRLNVSVDNGALSIEGSAVIAMPDGMEALHADVRSTRYERGFSLSSELDVDKVDANLKDGVLTLRIPKRAEHTPRKIEIRAE